LIAMLVLLAMLFIVAVFILKSPEDDNPS
jgi:hypothetical protein